MRRSGHNNTSAAVGEHRDAELETEADHGLADTEHATAASPRSGRLRQGSQGIDVEIAIVRMLLAKVVAGLRLGLTPGENLPQLIDEVLQFLAGKFPTEPKHQSCYLAHGGESLGNLAGSLMADFRKRDFTAFFACRQLLPREFQPECGKPSWLTNRPRLTTSAGGRNQKCQFLPRIQQNIGLEKESF